MVEEDIQKWQRWQKGEYFPWDAFTSGEDSKILAKGNKQFGFNYNSLSLTY